MDFKKERVLLACFVFLFSFLWIFSLTYNFNFFWEDSFYLGQYELYIQNPEGYTPLKFIIIFFKNIVDPDQFYRIDYRRQLEDELFYPFIATLLGIHVLLYRIGVAFVFSCFMVLCSTIFYKLGEQFILPLSEKPSFSFLKPSLLLPILLCFYVTILPTTWVITLYLPDDLLLSLTFTTSALLLFYFFYNNDTIKNKYLLGTLFFFIILFTKFSILINHVGRINVLIMFLFLLFTERKKLATLRYSLLLFVLFSQSFPILGIFKLFSEKTLLDILGITYHIGINPDASVVFSFFSDFIKTFHYSFLPHAFFLLLLFFIFFILHSYALCVKKEGKEGDTKIIQELRALTFFSFFWFFLSAFSLYLVRGFIFDPFFFLRFEFTLFIVPQTLFLLSYCLFIYKKYFSEKNILRYMLYIFLILAILHNLGELNNWRGGWGAYFLGYDTVRQYIDEHEENALLLLPMDHASPTYFVPPSTNKYAMVADLTNTALIHEYAQNYSAIYITQRYPLVFDDPSIVNVANLTIKDTSPYGVLKKAVGRYYPTPMYLYKFQE